MSPLLQRIERELAAAEHPLRRAELMAERACYLARTGKFPEAASIINTLKLENFTSSNLIISIWVMVAEGLTLHFKNVSSQAHDRLIRAHALSRSGNVHYLSAITSAWLGHLELIKSDYPKMSEHLQLALKLSDPGNYQARIRTGMALGDALLHLGYRKESQQWYESARHIASSVGDEAAIGAIMYNRAAFNLNLLRINEYLKQDQIQFDELLDFARLEIESATNFQWGTGIASLHYLLDICRGQALQLQKDYAGAIDRYLVVTSSNIKTDDFSDKAPLLVDLALCFSLTGNNSAAMKYVDKITTQELRRLDPDDRFLCLSKLKDLEKSGLTIEFSSEIDIELESARDAYLRNQSALSASLEFVHNIRP